MFKKISLSLLALLIGLSPLLTAMPVFALGTLYESHDVAQNGMVNPTDTTWFAQTFIPSVTHTITDIGLPLGTGANQTIETVYIDIFGTTGGVPTGSSLANGTISNMADTTETWHYCTLGNTTNLYAGYSYAIVVHRNTDTDTLKWYKKTSDTYVRGDSHSSSNSGASFGAGLGQDCKFKEYGTPYSDPETPPTVTTSAASAVTSTGATLNGNLTSMGSFGSVATYFEYGLTAGYGTTVGYDFQSAITTFNETITGLASNTTYHYRVVAYGDTAVNGTDGNFTTSSPPILPDETPPTVTTGSVTIIDNATARIYGSLTDLGSNTTGVTVGFNFGTGSPAEWYFDAYETPMNETGTFSVILGSLTPGTTYYYQASATGDGVGAGEYLTFVPVSAVTKPTVITEAASFIVGNAARLNGNLTSLGSSTAVNVTFQTKRTSATDWLTPSVASPLMNLNATQSFYESAIGFAEGVQYDFRAIAYPENETALGLNTAYGEVMHFTAGYAPTPIVFNVSANPATAITSTGATLTMRIDGTDVTNATETSGYFQYGIYSLGNAYLQTTAEQPRTGPGTISTTLTGLQPSTQYKSWAYGIVNGQIKTSDWVFFTTLATGGATPGVTPTPTPSPGTNTGVNGTIGPFSLPDDWVTSGTSYLWLIGLMLGSVAVSIFLFAPAHMIKLGAMVGALLAVVILCLWLSRGWIEPLIIGLAIALVAAIFAGKIKALVSG